MQGCWGMLAVAGLATTLSACATGPSSFPVEATRFHYNAMTDRGTIEVEPLSGDAAPSLEYRAYADAVQAQLARQGYTTAAPGTTPRYYATVGFTRATRPLPPRRAPVTLGIGGGSYGGGGVGVGGGVGIPVGGSGVGQGVVTELSVRIREGANAVWEGQAQSLTDTSAPDAQADAVASRLAAALFQGFPGESGRTIEVP